MSSSSTGKVTESRLEELKALPTLLGQAVALKRQKTPELSRVACMLLL